MELAGVLPPPMDRPGRGRKPAGATAAAAATNASGEEDEMPDSDDASDSDEAPLLMEEDEGMDDLGQDEHSDRNPPEVDLDASAS